MHTMNPDRMVVYARGYRAPDAHNRIYVPLFDDAGYARAWLDFFLENEVHRREKDTILLDSGVSLKSEQLDRILAAKPTDINAKDERRILRFKYGTWDEVHAKPVAIERASRPDRDARPERPTGYVTITELCAGSDVLPLHARAALRASGRDKPAYGWAFDPKDVPAIKQLCGIK